MKSQALADFVVKYNFFKAEQGEIFPSNEEKPWTLFADGSSTMQFGGA